ncbi:MAG: AAA family ATPase [Nannocystaceae bacterium]|nr:AAA family ATPase [Myxococcales bacterium]
MASTQDDLGPIFVEPPVGGFDRAGVRDLVKESGLAKAVHRVAAAPFGHTVLTLRALDAVIAAGDLAVHAGEAVHAALLEDIARTGTLAIPEPTRDQRLFIGAFTVTALCDALVAELAALAPTPALTSDLEADGLEGLLERAPRELVARIFALAGGYLELQAKRRAEVTAPTLEERSVAIVTTIHAFFAQLRGAVERLTHHGRLRPFGIALARRTVVVGERRYEGFHARARAEPAADLKPIQVADIVGNREYVEAGLRLARDVAAYDLVGKKSPKSLNPVIFGLGRPGCGKTITAHAIGNYFLEYCKQRDIPARFKVIRRTDWASSYQNASAATLIKIFREEVYGFDGVCGVYWPDIDTAFASRASGDLRMEEKNNLGAVFGIFDGTLIPRDGKWFMICDANYMQMDEATSSRIAQNPFTVKGPTTPDDYVRLLRDILLRDVRDAVAPGDPAWRDVGAALTKADLSGRQVESIAGNIRAHVQDFEYPDHYFKADFQARARIIAELSRKLSVADVITRIDDYVRFHAEAEEREASDRFEREVSQMVHQLNAGREATARAAKAAERAILAGEPSGS